MPLPLAVQNGFAKPRADLLRGQEADCDLHLLLLHSWVAQGGAVMAAFLSFENLRYEKRNQIAFITVARPKVLNALNIQTVQELGRAFQSVRDDVDVRVAVLTGDGEKAFVAGADINDFAGRG
jgi:hypothetical protein